MFVTDTFILCPPPPPTVMPYNSAHHCVVEVENFLLLLGGEDQWNPNGTIHTCLLFMGSNMWEKKEKHVKYSVVVSLLPPKNTHVHIYISPVHSC